MSRSFSNAKVLSAVVVDGISNAIYRRGFAAAASSQGVVSSVAKAGAVRSGTVKKTVEEATAEKVAWVPDPVTGFYKPENCGNEIDAAELRAVLLKKH